MPLISPVTRSGVYPSARPHHSRV